MASKLNEDFTEYPRSTTDGIHPDMRNVGKFRAFFKKIFGTGKKPGRPKIEKLEGDAPKHQETFADAVV